MHHPCHSTSCCWRSHCSWAALHGRGDRENRYFPVPSPVSTGSCLQGFGVYRHSKAGTGQPGTQKWKLWSSHRNRAAPGWPPHASVSQCKRQMPSASQEYIHRCVLKLYIYVYIYMIKIKIFYTDRGLLAFQFQYVLFHWQPLRAGSLSDGIWIEEEAHKEGV